MFNFKILLIITLHTFITLFLADTTKTTKITKDFVTT